MVLMVGSQSESEFEFGFGSIKKVQILSDSDSQHWLVPVPVLKNVGFDLYSLLENFGFFLYMYR
jgi:hypothetical protein